MWVSLQCQLCHGDWCVFHYNVSYAMVIDVCFTQMSAMSWRLMCVSLQGQLWHGDCFHSSNVSYTMCVSLQRQLCHGDWCVFRSNDWWLCFAYSNVSDAIGDCGWFTPMLAVSWWLIVFGLLQCQLCHGDWLCLVYSHVSYVIVDSGWLTPMSAESLWLIVFGVLQCQLCHSWLWLVYSSAISAMMVGLLQC